jgi:hypothetical protein
VAEIPNEIRLLNTSVIKSPNEILADAKIQILPISESAAQIEKIIKKI